MLSTMQIASLSRLKLWQKRPHDREGRARQARKPQLRLYKGIRLLDYESFLAICGRVGAASYRFSRISWLDSECRGQHLGRRRPSEDLWRWLAVRAASLGMTPPAVCCVANSNVASH